MTRQDWPVVAVVSAGGVCGALARYGLAAAWPYRPGGFPWGTLVTNVSGCLLIGGLMVFAGGRFLRPFLGTGVLGGYTTFSAYAVDVVATARAGAPVTALAYLAGTVVAAVLAVWAGGAATRKLAGR
ncbi:FluC/FEX family fluoride channel [Amycolatopsis suaedae]|uniref:Fluoride-specific ion channel FluC n=1 Tax=Amycolatopsis suaedae TaxID=2510978 RepID=A0A4V2ELX1_9PSEU|nr:CrcB family protein [Amycolatopsis suaedae]RZQ63045.1 CrcB family protein [Amycolatopsis suaedae]